MCQDAFYQLQHVITVGLGAKKLPASLGLGVEAGSAPLQIRQKLLIGQQF